MIFYLKFSCWAVIKKIKKSGQGRAAHQPTVKTFKYMKVYFDFTYSILLALHSFQQNWWCIHKQQQQQRQQQQIETFGNYVDPKPDKCHYPSEETVLCITEQRNGKINQMRRQNWYKVIRSWSSFTILNVFYFNITA